MSVQLTVDLKELYQKLCPECKKKVLELIKMRPTEEIIKKALEG